MSKQNGRTPGVDSARRVLKILLLFGGERPELSVEDIATEMSISTPSVYRYLSLLREVGFVEMSSRNHYSLTPRVLTLADSAERAFKASVLLRPIVRELSTEVGEAALAIRRIGDHATCAEIAQVEHTVRISFQPGQVLSLHRGAGSKVLLASMGDSWIQEYMDRIPANFAPCGGEELRKELAKVQNQGWAVSSAEVDEGVWAVAAPVHIGRKTIAALSVAGPQYRIDEERQEQIRAAVIAKASQASEELGRQVERW